MTAWAREIGSQIVTVTLCMNPANPPQLASPESSRLWTVSLLWRHILAIPLLATSVGCASVHSVSKAYNDVEVRKAGSFRPTLLILIDGLSYEQWRSNQNQLQTMNAHFEFTGQAHSTLPSVTFTSIGSLLTQKPVSQTGFIGNQVPVEESSLNFESPMDRIGFAQLLQGETVFHTLKTHGYGSASFDYGLGLDATASSYRYDLQSVLDIRKADYLAADHRQIESLRFLLQTTQPKNLPALSFLHLVGLDFINHEYGPESKQAKEYLIAVDGALSGLLKEAAHLEMVSVLTSDHGFKSDIMYFLDIESIVDAVAPGAEVYNESRAASIFLKDPKALQREKLLVALKGQITIGALAYREKENLIVWRRSGEERLEYRPSKACRKSDFEIRGPDLKWICPDQLEYNEEDPQPFFLKNLSHLFAVKRPPDLLLIPNERTSFKKDETSAHGGPEREEVIVPLLLRNAEVQGHGVPAIWEILKFILKTQSAVE